MDKQQTAVEWIEYQVQQQGITHYFSLREILEQAKEMEKERMIEFGELCWKNLLRSDVIMRPRDVYNETYGGNK
jgi:hypothetical protein